MANKKDSEVASVRIVQVLDALSDNVWKTLPEISSCVVYGGEQNKIRYLLEILINKNLAEKKVQKTRETVVSRVLFSNTHVYRKVYRKK